MAEITQPMASYLGAVPKAKVLEAVSEAVSAGPVCKLDGMQKDALLAQAERQLDGRR
jgi:ParB family chromosome partitioning protein